MAIIAKIAALTSIVMVLTACETMPSTRVASLMTPASATPVSPLQPPSPSGPVSVSPVATAFEPAPGPSAASSAASDDYVKLTSFLVIDPATTETGRRTGWIGGTYTRLMIRGHLDANGKVNTEGKFVPPRGGKPMRYEPRNWMVRAFWGKESATNLALSFKIDTHEQVASLLTVGRQSNSQGERWERTISHSDYSFPYFLVHNDGTSSTPKLTFKLKSDNTYKSQGFAAALSVALQVADKLVNEPIVVNTLASTASREKAKAADFAISQLFGTSVVEQHTTDRDLAAAPNSHLFTLGANGVTVRLLLPVEEGDYTSEPKSVGTWNVGFDDPKPSIFSPVRICVPTAGANPEYCFADVAGARKSVAAGLSAPEVLKFVLTPPPGTPITINAFLRARPYFQTSPPLFTSTDAAARLRAYNYFCQSVVSDIVALGFNDFDGRAVLWSVVRDMPDVIMADSVPSNSSCKTRLSDFPV